MEEGAPKYRVKPFCPMVSHPDNCRDVAMSQPILATDAQHGRHHVLECWCAPRRSRLSPVLRLVRIAVAKQAQIRYAWFLEVVVAFLISLLYYESAPGDRCSRYGYREIETRDKRWQWDSPAAQ